MKVDRIVISSTSVSDQVCSTRYQGNAPCQLLEEERSNEHTTEEAHVFPTKLYSYQEGDQRVTRITHKKAGLWRRRLWSGPRR